MINVMGIPIDLAARRWNTATSVMVADVESIVVRQAFTIFTQIQFMGEKKCRQIKYRTKLIAATAGEPEFMVAHVSRAILEHAYTDFQIVPDLQQTA